MDPERWKQVDNLLQQALKHPVEERETFLQHACGNDSALVDEVLSLLESQQRAGSFLESPAIEVAADSLTKEGPFSGVRSPELEPGTMIAHYRVTGKIGQGGMGEVYRALDTKLQRDVALKILPEAMARDNQRMARFEREAQVLASLNHPNIAAIHGLEESNGIRALVMELVEGKTLAERISVASVSPPPGRLKSGSAGSGSGNETTHRGVSMEDAFPIARQIAEALEYAHERGVIHRDLKPANVKVTPEGTVKVLDFGLAKVMNPQDSSVTMDMVNSPTLSSMATRAGMILGTAAYMSPEQAKGQRVDRRCDIWAFGCVLFEMLTGRKAFGGETITDVLAAVIRAEPDWNALSATTPPSIQRLIRRCLQKDQRQRLQAIGEARITIEETISGSDSVAAVYDRRPSIQEKSGAHRAPLQRTLPWAVAGLLAVALIVSVVLGKFSAPKPQPVTRFTVLPPENTAWAPWGWMSLSPDGRQLAFVTWTGPGSPGSLWVRSFDALTARAIQGAEGAAVPFWSPDGNYLGFYVSGKLWKVAMSGGPPQALCVASGPGGVGATWNRTGVIVFASHGRLYRVPDAGGTPTLVAGPDASLHEQGYRLPQFLPDGRHILFTIQSTSPNANKPYSVAVGSLDSSEVRRLAATSSNALYALPGYLLYLQGSTLMARPFDVGRLEFDGQALPIAEGVGMLPLLGYGHFAVSRTGVLAYGTGGNASLSQMVWVNRQGKKLGMVGQPGLYEDPALSHDGTKLAVGQGEVGKRDIWVYDLKRGSGSRLNSHPADDFLPAWSADGSRIVFTSIRRAQRDLYEKPANGLGSTQPLFVSEQQAKSLHDLSPDGRYAIYGAMVTGGLWVLPLFGDRKPLEFVQGQLQPRSARFSPKGVYVAYSSRETGRDEVYVQTFPQHQGKWPVSTSGGVEPMWRRDGKELFFLDPNGKLMAVEVNTESGRFQPGAPRALFQAHLIGSGSRNRYAVSPDGQRFLMLEPARGAKPQKINVVLNWPALLENAGK